MLFISTKEGAYRHEILGLFSSIEKAIERGVIYVRDEESDGYHFVVVSELNIDESLAEDAKKVAEVKRVGYSVQYGHDGMRVVSKGSVVVERF